MQVVFVDHQTLAKLADRNLLTLADDSDLDEIKQKVRQAISRLSPNQQTIIIMYYFEDASIEQIAARMDLTPKQIHKSLSAARTTIKHALQRTVESRWPSIGQTQPACQICLHPRRAEIEKMISEKPDSHSWRLFNEKLSNEFGLKINPPIKIKHHVKYHPKG
jgi:hypothetical protein